MDKVLEEFPDYPNYPDYIGLNAEESWNRQAENWELEHNPSDDELDVGPHPTTTGEVTTQGYTGPPNRP